MTRNALTNQCRSRRGQATVEFTLSFMLFALLGLGVFDAARVMFTLNGLNRAAEVVAHGLADQYDSNPANITSKGAQGFIQQAQSASDLSFSTAEPTAVANGNGYQQLSNGSAYICGAPNLDAQSLMVIKVTVKASFTPAFSMFIGGRAITLSKSATVMTQNAEQAGGSYMYSCPSP